MVVELDDSEIDRLNAIHELEKLVASKGWKLLRQSLNGESDGFQKKIRVGLRSGKEFELLIRLQGMCDGVELVLNWPERMLSDLKEKVDEAEEES